LIFCPLKDQVKGLSVGGRDSYAVGGAVQKHRFQKLTLFCGISRKVKKMRLVREFKSSLHGQPMLTPLSSHGARN
jgi:hypothetical protein